MRDTLGGSLGGANQMVGGVGDGGKALVKGLTSGSVSGTADGFKDAGSAIGGGVMGGVGSIAGGLGKGTGKMGGGFMKAAGMRSKSPAPDAAAAKDYDSDAAKSSEAGSPTRQDATPTTTPAKKKWSLFKSKSKSKLAV